MIAVVNSIFKFDGWNGQVFFYMFLNPNIFYNLNSNVAIYMIREISRNKSKKHSVNKNCFDLSLLEQIVLVISGILQIHWPSASNFKIFFDHHDNFFSQNVGTILATKCQYSLSQKVLLITSSCNMKLAEGLGKARYDVDRQSIISVHEWWYYIGYYINQSTGYYHSI